ncbi:MAG: hypothetical protein WCA14_17615, partial [Steroidobacteraceae bacterium]
TDWARDRAIALRDPAPRKPGAHIPVRPLGATRLAPVATLAAANEKRGFRSPLTACGGGHIHVPWV